MENNFAKSLEKFTSVSDSLTSAQSELIKDHLTQASNASIKSFMGKIFMLYVGLLIISLAFWHQKGMGIFSVNINQFITFLPEIVRSFLDGLVASSFGFFMLPYLLNKVDQIIFKRTYHQISVYVSFAIGFFLNILIGINIISFLFWILGSLLGCYLNFTYSKK